MRPGLNVSVWLKVLGNLLSACFPPAHKNNPTKKQ